MTDDAEKQYYTYLTRYIRNTDMSLWDAHQLLISRMVAREYGLTEEQIRELGENL